MAPRSARRAPPAPPIAAIVGPTASGKTELAMAIAARQPVEILVADSRQVYRGM
ncbi:MAG TPA: isopentenyl transferase family protein, partial [Methylomirabilota bacterium]